MKTTVLVFVDRENTSMGMRIASQEELTPAVYQGCNC